MEMRLLLAFALFLTSFAQDDHYCVVKDSGLVGAYATADEAKSAMASFSRHSQRAAFVVSGGVLNRDPHNVADSRGNLQKNGGTWNKFWWNWNTINAMADVAEGSSECMDFTSAVTWTHVGYGGCTGGKWMNIGTANSLKEAKELMLSDERCNSDQAKLFYSAYSYTSSWGVRCATKGNYEDCTEQNTNWQEYIVHIESGEDLEYTCQKYYATDDCSGKVIGMATKKYGGCQPYLFEADAAGKYFDLLGRGGHCDKTCTHCEVEAPAITTDIMVGGKNPICRSRKYLGISDETSPTWNFTPGPCPNLCEQFYAIHPGCDENYDGDLPCQPTQEQFDYAPQCFKLLENGPTEWICVDGLPEEEGTSLHGVGSPGGDSLQAQKDACEAFPGCNSFARNVNGAWFPKSGFTMDDNNWRSNVSPDWSFCYMVDKHVQKATCSVDTWDGYLFQSKHPRSLNQDAEHGKTYKIIDFSNKLWYGKPVGPNYRPGVSSAVIKGEGCEISFKDKDGNVKCTLGPGSYEPAAFTPDCGNDVVVEYDVNVKEAQVGDKRRQHTGPRYAGCVPVDYIPWDQVVSIGTIDLNIGLVPRECRKKCQNAGFAHFGLLTNDFAECFCGKSELDLDESDVFTKFRDCKGESLVIFTTSQFVQYENSPKQSDVCVDLCATGEAGSLCTCDTQPPAKSLTMGPESAVGLSEYDSRIHKRCQRETSCGKCQMGTQEQNWCGWSTNFGKCYGMAHLRSKIADPTSAAWDRIIDINEECPLDTNSATEWICVDGLPEEEGTSLQGVVSPGGDSLQARKDACEAFPGCNSFARNVNKEWFPKSGFTMDDNNWRSNVSPDWSFCYIVDKNIQKETSLARQNQRLAQVNRALREALQTLQN